MRPAYPTGAALLGAKVSSRRPLQPGREVWAGAALMTGRVSGVTGAVGGRVRFATPAHTTPPRAGGIDFGSVCSARGTQADPYFMKQYRARPLAAGEETFSSLKAEPSRAGPG